MVVIVQRQTEFIEPKKKDDEVRVLRDFGDAKKQVLYLLEKHPQARNNDFYLQWLWLASFGEVDVPIPYLSWESIKRCSGKLETVRRTRQKIQNELKLFLPDDVTRVARQSKANTMRMVIHDV